MIENLRIWEASAFQLIPSEVQRFNTCSFPVTAVSTAVATAVKTVLHVVLDVGFQFWHFMTLTFSIIRLSNMLLENSTRFAVICAQAPA